MVVEGLFELTVFLGISGIEADMVKIFINESSSGSQEMANKRQMSIVLNNYERHKIFN